MLVLVDPGFELARGVEQLAWFCRRVVGSRWVACPWNIVVVAWAGIPSQGKVGDDRDAEGCALGIGGNQFLGECFPGRSLIDESVA